LSVRDRDKWFISKPVEDRNEIGKIEPSVQRGEMRNRQTPTNGKMKVTGVEMDDIELASVLKYVIYQQNFACHGIFALFVFSK